MLNTDENDDDGATVMIIYVDLNELNWIGSWKINMYKNKVCKKNLTILTAIKNNLVKKNKKTKVSIFGIALYKILLLTVYVHVTHIIAYL